MVKGEIWLANLNPIRGKEQQGLRPVVIISGNAMNAHFDLTITCPLTTKLKNFIGDIILQPGKENGLAETSEILIFQIRSISKSRLIEKIGQITSSEMTLIEENLMKVLRY